MKPPIFLFLAILVLAFNATLAQQSRIPVYVSRTGKDNVGSLFETALKQELSRSAHYMPRYSEGTKTKLEFHIDLSTIDIADSKPEQGKKSAVSIVIGEFGRAGSYPVETTWYHKVVLVDKEAVATVAIDLLDNMDARYCSYIKNSVGNCPKEKFDPPLY
jgi:hypothetical protein